MDSTNAVHRNFAKLPVQSTHIVVSFIGEPETTLNLFNTTFCKLDQPTKTSKMRRAAQGDPPFLKLLIETNSQNHSYSVTFAIHRGPNNFFNQPLKSQSLLF